MNLYTWQPNAVKNQITSLIKFKTKSPRADDIILSLILKVIYRTPKESNTTFKQNRINYSNNF